MILLTIISHCEASANDDQPLIVSNKLTKKVSVPMSESLGFFHRIWPLETQEDKIGSLGGFAASWYPHPGVASIASWG